MPAETHRLGEPVDGPAVLDLFWALVARPGDPETPDRDLTLRQLDVDDDISVLELWESATEEFAERTVGEPDIESLRDAATIGALADTVALTLRRGRSFLLPSSDNPKTSPARR
jgi:hypothetical protein